MSQAWGFRPEIKEEHQMKKMFGLEMISLDKEPYKFNIGKAVTISTGGQTEGGIYQGMTTMGAAVLYPSVKRVNIPESFPSRSNSLFTTYARWEKDRPLVMNVPHFVMSPTNVEEINHILGIGISQHLLEYHI